MCPPYLQTGDSKPLSLGGAFVFGVLTLLWIGWVGMTTGTRLSAVLPVAAGFGVVAFIVGWLTIRALGWLADDRRRLIVAALSIFAAIGLFPPWVYTFGAPGMATSTRSAGYHLILRPPAPAESNNPYYGIRIDIMRLAIQCAVVAAIAGALVMRSPREPPLKP